MSLYEVNDGVAIITLDRPPLNTQGLPLRRHLDDALRATGSDSNVVAIVITGAGRCFSGGGDITEFNLPAGAEEPQAPALFARLEASPKPVVAAIHGMALGGGLELALACHARVAHASTQVGLPEVNLGLLPGAGGTQRLPRLVGVETALNLILKGTVSSAAALADSGLFDRVTEGSVLEEAITLARSLAADVAENHTLRRTSALACHMDNAQAFIAFARSTLKTPAGGPTAAQACLDCIEAAVCLPFAEGMAVESERFRGLATSSQFAGLRHAFLAERAAANVLDLPDGTSAREIKRAAVIGGGTMGSGIAITLANARLAVLLIEREQAALDRAFKTIREYYEQSVQRGKLSSDTAAARIALISGATDYAGIAEADLVIEAVFEDLEVKREVFERLDAVAKPGAILASNTSMLDLDLIAAFTRRPQDVIGLHFFSPAPVMKLLEVVRGAKTAPDVLVSALALAKKIGKTAVVAGVCEGFIGNRMIEAYLMQAGLLLDEGALPHQVDLAMEQWGMAMGPFRMSDMAGNDVGAKIRAARIERDASRVYSGVSDLITAMGRYGQKAGRGWYDYPPGARKPSPSPEVQSTVVAHSAQLGLQRRHISDEEIVDRLVLALVNEGFKLLEEGIAQRASDIDVVYTAGYGFPRWRGGPMLYAEQRGLADVIAALSRFSVGPVYQHAEHFWRPAPLLVRLAESGQSLAQFNLKETP
ncbi:3-hydroxyacyl-CoA dehydrogenase NAD-binding domain-containing protein [Pseudomonas sp. TH10]|uniref:3-hydroxyacyl-CoA dehydrogenase NAD-binding domain-containing protein n=1 Tax=Pseudomonas sp. TH10 TaxID=2796376 RepID=UPI0019144BE1|nr:3-hydroxyacyl-CoA dehydrogenase NAD-binding domain-containing protein [Pseudomonas sp. TH10]MBK5517243.1 enoyl-CoA hydratase/isomerase family protein [Pseudomonas sp. TH10]